MFVTSRKHSEIFAYLLFLYCCARLLHVIFCALEHVHAGDAFYFRRRIADFYHRTSMSSYCTAFAYRPVTQNLSNELEEVYIELPDAADNFFEIPISPSITR